MSQTCVIATYFLYENLLEYIVWVIKYNKMHILDYFVVLNSSISVLFDIFGSVSAMSLSPIQEPNPHDNRSDIPHRRGAGSEASY